MCSVHGLGGEVNLITVGEKVDQNVLKGFGAQHIFHLAQLRVTHYLCMIPAHVEHSSQMLRLIR